MRSDPGTGKETVKRKLIMVEVTCNRWGSNSSPSVKIIEVPMIDDGTVRLDITLDLRKTDTVVIRPIRRELDDVEGLIEDAERLANS